MSELLLERQEAAADLAEQFEPSDTVRALAGRLVVAAQFGPTNAGKGHHGPLALQEIDRRGLTGELQTMGVNRYVIVRPFATREMRDSEGKKPEEERPYEWYCNPEVDEEWGRLESLLATGGLCQVIKHDSGKVYGTRIELYQPDALNLVEYVGAECLRLDQSDYFRDFNATLLFPKQLDAWIRKVIDRDGPNPPHFPERLKEGLDAMYIARCWGQYLTKRPISLVVNDYGEEGEYPAYMGLADGYLRRADQQHVDRQGANQDNLAHFFEQFGNFRQTYLANPRPLTDYVLAA